MCHPRCYAAQSLKSTRKNWIDGMPPLVDNPNPPMTFTFANDMSPLTFDTSIPPPPPRFEVFSEDTFISSPPHSPQLGPDRPSHAKKRDASYIPRPPNAFILFRSAFIRAENIPEKIEGNRSTLSKIIGKYWKTLPREEREIWEAKAVKAQAEHRQKYPDWRFRPGANALAKVKDGPKRRNNKKGRGEAEEEERSREKRCTKIADLLVKGKKGSDLAEALREYEKPEEVVGTLGQAIKAKEVEQTVKVEGGSDEGGIVMKGSPVGHHDEAAEPARVRCQTPDPATMEARFKVPLTAMFKRSSSAPAVDVYVPQSTTPGHGAQCNYNDTFALDIQSPLSVYSALSPVSSVDGQHEADTRVPSDVGFQTGGYTTPPPAAQCVQSVDPFSWYSTPVLSPTPEGTPFTFYSPSPSPLDPLASFVPSQAVQQSAQPISPGFYNTCQVDSSPANQQHSVLSSYSSLKGWAGDNVASRRASPLTSYLPLPSDPVYIVNNDGYEDQTGGNYQWWETQYQHIVGRHRFLPGEGQGFEKCVEGMRYAAYDCAAA
ncbi:hypothetical protein JAAARDRAFT_182275 [Jaapia argillacea MUCL 33604]|uniref:HMG box domain-containing protein n=1 Tax=Jaapia argillacea MUCL 33604 TaxID=933084 RepID=A0A067PKB9_9AGAM|nr:hypothetical protein JAAARDRAFT_182275 [Jaapia argillacea MUCL 33604]